MNPATRTAQPAKMNQSKLMISPLEEGQKWTFWQAMRTGKNKLENVKYNQQHTGVRQKHSLSLASRQPIKTSVVASALYSGGPGVQKTSGH